MFVPRRPSLPSQAGSTRKRTNDSGQCDARESPWMAPLLDSTPKGQVNLAIVDRAQVERREGAARLLSASPRIRMPCVGGAAGCRIGPAAAAEGEVNHRSGLQLRSHPPHEEALCLPWTWPRFAKRAALYSDMTIPLEAARGGAPGWAGAANAVRRIRQGPDRPRDRLQVTAAVASIRVYSGQAACRPHDTTGPQRSRTLSAYRTRP
jgi:hypothetical protein